MFYQMVLFITGFTQKFCHFLLVYRFKTTQYVLCMPFAFTLYCMLLLPICCFKCHSTNDRRKKESKMVMNFFWSEMSLKYLVNLRSECLLSLRMVCCIFSWCSIRYSPTIANEDICVSFFGARKWRWNYILWVYQLYQDGKIQHSMIEWNRMKPQLQWPYRFKRENLVSYQDYVERMTASSSLDFNGSTIGDLIPFIC